MDKPNIVFILTDDQRFDTIHALGNAQIRTPNLDKLVQRSVAFTRAHIPGGTSGAVCMPSRAMLNSGRTEFHIDHMGEEIPCCHTTMGECFKQNGYETIGIGKWHNGVNAYARSFTDGDNIFFGGMWDHWNVPVCSFHPDGKYENKVRYTRDFFQCNHPMDMIADKIHMGVHSTELLTDTAIGFLEKDYDRPFMLYLAMLAPHDPRTMPDEFKNMYHPEDIDLPENFAGDHPFFFGSGDETRDEALAHHPRGEMEIKQHICDYYAMISHIDYHIGRLMDTLEKTGKLDNTIIVFTGDNGLAVGRHGLMGKQNLYDHSVRVPLLISGPGIPQNVKTDSFVYLLDIYPTLCDLAGIQIPESVEGISFQKVLKNPEEKTRNELYFGYTKNIRAIKNDRYKLIEYRMRRDQTQLFDLQNDPNEMVNLYGDARYQQVAKELKEQMLSYKEQWEDDPDNEFTKGFWQEVCL